MSVWESDQNGKTSRTPTPFVKGKKSMSESGERLRNGVSREENVLGIVVGLSKLSCADKPLGYYYYYYYPDPILPLYTILTSCYPKPPWWPPILSPRP